MPAQQVVDLHTRRRLDAEALARQRITEARQRLGLTHAEFADALTPLVGWAPSPEVVESWETQTVPPGDVLVAAGFAAAAGRDDDESEPSIEPHGRCGDVAAVFPSRSEFAASYPPAALFDGASDIRALGLSLNLLAQSYPDKRMRALLEAGAEVRCLFLDPRGSAIRAREREERYAPGALSALTDLNIQITQRLRDALPGDTRARLRIAVYDEPPRFNIIVVDHTRMIVQPYMPESRGVDSPTFVIERSGDEGGLYPVFEQVLQDMWEGSAAL